MKTVGLAFAAIDMVETPGGDFVFLEMNPSGQWLWIDDKLGLDISDAVTTRGLGVSGHNEAVHNGHTERFMQIPFSRWKKHTFQGRA